MSKLWLGMILFGASSLMSSAQNKAGALTENPACDQKTFCQEKFENMPDLALTACEDGWEKFIDGIKGLKNFQNRQQDADTWCQHFANLYISELLTDEGNFHRVSTADPQVNTLASYHLGCTQAAACERAKAFLKR